MIEYFINDMTCGHCASVITKAIAEVDAAAKVEIDLSTHQVRISGIETVEEVEAAIREAGYTPERIV